MAGIQINHPSGPGPADGEQSWDTKQLQEDFSVEGFASPFVVVRRKSDGVRGSLQFAGPTAACPERVYWGFVED